MTCDKCGGPAKPLLVGKYCVNDCDQGTYHGDMYVELTVPDDFWDEPTFVGNPCPHDDTYYGVNGNKSGDWCKDCGKLLEEDDGD